MDNCTIDLKSHIECQRAAFRTYQLVPLSIIITVGFVANILVIHAGAKKSSRQKYSTNSFILSLAVADLGMICFFIPIHVVEYTAGLHAEDWTCKYIIPIRETFSFMSMLTVAALGVVRLFQIHLGRLLSMRLTHVLITAMWLFGYSITSLPLSFVFRHTDYDTCDAVWASPKKKKIYIGFLSLMMLVPLMVTTCCYICIILKMRKFNRGFASTKIELQLKSQKISILLFMLIVANWLGLVPFLIYSMLKVFVEIYSKYPYEEWSIMSALFFSTSAINPVLILIANKDYRNEIRRMFYKRERIVPLALQRVQVKPNIAIGLNNKNFFENPAAVQITKFV